MTRFSVNITTDNAAFEELGPEEQTARILEDIAESLRGGKIVLNEADTFPFHDANGNQVCIVKIYPA